MHRVPSRFVLEFDWRGPRLDDDTWSGSKANRLIGGVLTRRLNPAWSRSIALVVRALFHWLHGSRVKVKSRSPASSRLSATALHLSRHLQRNARRRCSISAGEAA